MTLPSQPDFKTGPFQKNQEQKALYGIKNATRKHTAARWRKYAYILRSSVSSWL
jgi:hypothetical protein